MKVLVTGAKGQLGFDLCRLLEENKIQYLGIDIADCDLTKPEQVDRIFAQYLPTVVIHCAAYTAVDKAESEKDLCYDINVNATEHVAVACSKYHAELMYISTDYVFGGSGDSAYEIDSPLDPQNVYGQTKALGEKVVTRLLEKYYIVRISWVFGINGNNFVKAMLRLGAEKQSINVVNDQIGSPTYTYDLAGLLIAIIKSKKYGVYHATNEGTCSWAEFAEEIMMSAGLTCAVKPIVTAEYPTAALRPHNSRLSKASLDSAGFTRLPPWRDALSRYLMEHKSD